MSQLCCVCLFYSSQARIRDEWCFPLLCIRCNQELIAEAVLPTLRALFDAPNTSPLAEVKVTNVADLLIELTDVQHPMAAKQTPSASIVVKVRLYCHRSYDFGAPYGFYAQQQLLL